MHDIHSNNSKVFQCVICNDIFTRKSSLKRHNGLKHIETTTINKTQNTNEKTQNTNEKTQYCSENENYKCHLCSKEFSRNWSLNRHIEKCKGIINKLQCEYCERTFKHENSRFYHYKRCEKKKELASVSPKIANTVSQNMTVTHGGVINNQVDNSVNNNIIIVYNPNGNTPFLTEHLKAEDLKKIIKMAATKLDNRALEEYSKQIFSNKENRCIQKTNLNGSHSKIHIGDNKWEIQQDKNIYPQLALDMANNMSEFVDEKRESLKKDMYVRLRDFVDCMCDAGYINSDPTAREKEFLKEFKTFMNGLKIIVYENTTET